MAHSNSGSWGIQFLCPLWAYAHARTCLNTNTCTHVKITPYKDCSKKKKKQRNILKSICFKIILGKFYKTNLYDNLMPFNEINFASFNFTCREVLGKNSLMGTRLCF